MSDKSFKVKSGLQIPGVTSANILTTDVDGNVSSSSVLPISAGGTGQTSANNALNALLPLQTSNDNYFLQTSGISPQWSKVFYQAIKDNGTTVTPRGYLNIVGGTFSDDSTNDITTLTIPTNYVSTSGGSTITASSASTKGLIISGAASQTANLTEWQNSSGTVLSYVDASGSFTVPSLTVSGDFTVNGTTTNINTTNLVVEDKNITIADVATPTDTTADGAGITIKGATDKTFNWVNSTKSFTSSEDLIISKTLNPRLKIIDPTNGYTAGIDFITNFAPYSNTTSKIFFDFFGTASIQTITGNAGHGMHYVSGRSNYGNHWFRKSTTDGVQMAILNSGNVGINSTSPTGTLQVNNLNSSTVGLIVRGVSSQTADLQQWQNSAGTVLSYVTSSGSLRAPFLSDINGNGAFIQMNSNSSVTINTRNITNVGLVVFAQPSQTADLQQWQDSSGTVLASLSSSGNLMVQDLTVNGTTTTINSTTLTVDDKNIELASVTSPTDTTADGAGITIKGATDKTFNWVQSTAAFTSSEPISAPAFKSAGTAVSSNITLSSGYRYFVDTTAARTLTLPASPSLGDEIQIYDASNNALTNNITLASNSNKIQGSVQDLIIDSNAATVYLTYTGSTYGWAVN